jgi:hypothetical protein
MRGNWWAKDEIGTIDRTCGDHAVLINFGRGQRAEGRLCPCVVAGALQNALHGVRRGPPGEHA